MRLPGIPSPTTPIAVVAKFHCSPEEIGNTHEVEIGLSDPQGNVAHLLSERVIAGEVGENSHRTLGAAIVAAVDAQLEVEGVHVFHVSLDGTEIASLPLEVLVNDTPKAMATRARWMHDLGMSDEEIAELCDPEKYAGTTDEEAANLGARERMRSSNWSV